MLKNLICLAISAVSSTAQCGTVSVEYGPRTATVTQFQTSASDFKVLGGSTEHYMRVYFLTGSSKYRYSFPYQDEPKLCNPQEIASLLNSSTPLNLPWESDDAAVGPDRVHINCSQGGRVANTTFYPRTVTPTPVSCSIDAPSMITYNTLLQPGASTGSSHDLKVICDRKSTVRVHPSTPELLLSSGSDWSLASKISVNNENNIYVEGGPYWTTVPLSNWVYARGTKQIPAGTYSGNHILIMSIE